MKFIYAIAVLAILIGFGVQIGNKTGDVYIGGAMGGEKTTPLAFHLLWGAAR